MSQPRTSASAAAETRPSKVTRGLGRVLVFLAVGGLLSILIAWVLAVCLEVGNSTTNAAAEGVERDRLWTVSVMERSGGMWLVSQREFGAAWSPHQVTGSPDATGGRDDVAAWASASQDNQREWLLLTYAQAVVPQTLRIYETYCPGAVDRVSVFDENGQEHEVWRGQDPTPAGQMSGVSEIPILTDIKTKEVKIHLDSPRVPGWNEIDAVGLLDAEGKTWWAVDADASSTYGRMGRSASPYTVVWPLVPGWSGLGKPTEAFEKGEVKREERLVEAFGWPMLAMCGEREMAQSSGMTVSGLGFSPSGSRTYRVWTSATPLGTGGKQPAMLPLRPIWSGLAVDALFYTVVAWGFYWVSVKPRRFFVEVSRMRRGSCLKCGYQLNYDFAGGCPECGWRREGQR